MPIIGIGGIIKVYRSRSRNGMVIALAVVIDSRFVMLLVSIAMRSSKCADISRWS
ncbi:MAG: hypothetical protein ACLRYY_06265 [Anaerobutyricum soehngenii]